MPAGLLFLLLVSPFSRERNASEEEEGGAEEAVLSNMDGFGCFLEAIWWGWIQIQSLPCTAGEVGIVGFSALLLEERIWWREREEGKLLLSAISFF